MDESYRYWLTAFQQMIETKKYTQVALVEKIKEIAPDIRITKGHLNAVYKERTGRGNKIIKASIDLQEAIAKVYGFDYLEFLKAGRQILDNGNPLEQITANLLRDGQISEINQSDKGWPAADMSDLSDDEFDQRIEGYTLKIRDNLNQQAEYIVERIKAIAKTRAHIEQERIQLQSIIEASSDAIKVNRAADKVVTYENQAYRRLIGRSLLWKPCPGLCGESGEECYVDAVKIKGHAVHSIKKWNDRWYEIAANPINKDGVLHSVVAVIRDITEHYSKSIEAAHANTRLQHLLSLTNDTVNFFDENKQLVGSTFHHIIEKVERPTDLSSFILYAGNLFHGVTDAYEKLRQIYRDHQQCEFSAIHKTSGKEWTIKASSVYNEDEFIGIMIVSREA